jgi:hypothetical protein
VDVQSLLVEPKLVQQKRVADKKSPLRGQDLDRLAASCSELIPA